MHAAVAIITSPMIALGGFSPRASDPLHWVFLLFTHACTMLCLNVPSSDETIWEFIFRRLYWMLVGISGPKFVTTYVSGQLGTSTDSVRASRAIIGSECTIQHSSFTDVGCYSSCLQQESFFLGRVSTSIGLLLKTI
jgi:hypothetical protein